MSKYKPQEYKLGFKVSEEILKDDYISSMTEALRRNFRLMQEYQAYQILMDYDEECFFDEDEENFTA